MPPWIIDLFNWITGVLWWLAQSVWSFIDDNLTYTVIAAVYGVARLLGTVVESGSRGVLFRFGRVHKELSPGFHFLAPIIHGVRKMPVRSVSFQLPSQRIVTRDGLVYDVEANVVYHVEHPTVATVQVDDVHQGCLVVVPLVIAELIGAEDSVSARNRFDLERAFAESLQARFDRWGLVVERAGFKSIAPSRETLRITQLKELCAERHRAYSTLLDEGASEPEALTLLGGPQRLIERAASRCRNYQRRYAKKQRPRPHLVAEQGPFKVGDRVWANWLELGEHYPGVIRKITGNQVEVVFDDGDEETLDIRKVAREPPTSPK